MSYHSYGTTNIAFSTFDIWANNVSSDTNAGIDNALSDWYPTQSAPYQVSTLSGADCFYGTIAAGTGGQVQLSSPYTVGSSSSITVKNFDIGVYTLSMVAVPTYPYVFHSWRTAASGGGTQLSTSTTYSISGANTSTSYSTYYAYFV